MKLPEEKVQRILLLLRNDAQRLFERIKYREKEYMRIFSQRRTREQFKEIFISKYHDVNIELLHYLSQEVITALDSFYTKVDDLKWYLSSTEDMPASVEQRVNSFIHSIEESYQLLQLYISAEVGQVEGEAQKIPLFEDQNESAMGESAKISFEVLSEEIVPDISKK
jgi:hypothetical protein